MKLSGKRVLVTSGPTRAPLDAVRYITNKSTGRLGALIAEEALREGAEVTYIYGKGSALPQVAESAPLRLVGVETVPELMERVREELEEANYQAIIHSMAVLDYAPEAHREEKVPSGREEWLIRLVKTPKVIKMMRRLAPQAFLVGFKLEVGSREEALIAIAHRSLLANKADLVVANDLLQIERGNHVGYLVNPEGELVARAEGKGEIARRLIEIIGD
ncbi:MAG: phosphopantothenoylcysteine decarboxylase [Anaerolineae bacterium]